MSASDHTSSQFYFIHDKPYAENPRVHRLRVKDSKNDNLSEVLYHQDTEIPKTISVGRLESHIKGGNHAEKVMSHLYERYTHHNINWGLVIHPKAAFLLDSFMEKHPERTTGWVDLDNE